MQKVLYFQTGSGNHGCEAIVRTTAKILDGPKDVVLWSWDKEQEHRYGVETTVSKLVRNEELTRFSLPHIEAMIRQKLLKQPNAYLNVFIRELFKDTVAISIGGDNYCYPWSAGWACQTDEKIRKVCKKNVLWACSVEEDALTEEVRRDLAQFDLITARESITYELLKPINPNIVLVADPAFLLDRVDLPLPENFVENNTVGINVSPLIMQYGDGGIIMQNYENLIRHILNNTDMHICLIPHVIQNGNTDLEPIAVLYDKFKDSGRICKIGDHNCMELKGFIARCRFFVGARTHATIAAYSSCVPTLVAGYSVKSRGIARDPFGTEENYVLPVQQLPDENALCRGFIWLTSHEDAVRRHLQSKIPTVQELAASGKAHLMALYQSV